MKNQALKGIVLVVVVMLTTMLVKIPLPSRGYFNFGDVAVVFAGLVLGSPVLRKGIWQDNENGIWMAFLVGGIGSALADILGGFAFFAPITFFAKALECGWAALASSTKGISHALALFIGGSFMVITYFALEALIPSIGMQGAFAEILPNLIQAAGGLLGGKIIFLALGKMTKSNG